jgi:hypothetical protein
MSENVNRQISIFIQTGEAEKAYNKLIEREKLLNAELDKTTDPKKMAGLRDQITKMQEPIDRLRKKMSGELTPSVNEVSKTVQNLRNQLKHMSEKDADFSKVLAQYRQATIELDAMRAKVANVKNAVDDTNKGNPFSRVLDFAKGAFLGGAMIGIVSGFSNFLRGSIDEALQAEEATARFKSTLDNLGRSDAFDRIVQRADEIAAKFKYLDNDDVVGVFNKLVDYGKLTEAQMNDLLPVIVDFAAKTRTSIGDSTDVIIKALEGNSKSLKTFGIEVSATGSATENLNEIMTTLKSKVEGAGQAFQDTAAGGIATAKQELADVKEEIGNQLIPALSGLLNWVNKGLGGLAILGKNLKNTFADVSTFLTEGWGAAKNQKNLRDFEKQIEIEKRVGIDAAAEYQTKSAEEVADRIFKLQVEIGAKDKLAKGMTRLIAEGAADEKDLKNAESAVRSLKVQLQELFKIQDGRTNTEVLGIDGTKDDKKKTKTKTARKDPAIEEQKQLWKELTKMKQDLDLFGVSEQDKAFARMEMKYAEMRQRAHGNSKLLLEIEKLYEQESWNLQTEFQHKRFEAYEKADDEKKKKMQATAESLLKRATSSIQRIQDDVTANATSANRDRVAGMELQLMKAHGKNRLALQLKLLDEEKNKALANTTLTENERELIKEQYRQKSQDAERAHWMNMVSVVLEFVQQAAQVLSQFDQVKTAKENSDLERDRKVNDRKKSHYDRQLKNKLMTQQDYDRKVAEMDKAQEAKEKEAKRKQFRRQQRMAIINALMAGAQGAQKTLAEWGMPLAIPWLALTAASTIAQLAVISAQKPPEMARGGKLTGPSHQSASRGMPVTDPTTGQVQALMEGGEGVTNKRTMADGRKYTVSGTPSQIISSLNAMHGGVSWDSAATLVPTWRTVTPQRMNFSRIHDSWQTVKFFADGGRFGAGNGSTGGSSDVMHPVMLNLADSINTLNTMIANGIPAYTVLSDQEKQQARRDAIISNSTLK